MKLLEQTIRELKGEEIEDDVRATVNLRVDLRIDETYVPDMNQRLMRLPQGGRGRAREDELDRVLEEARDRYGPLPESVLNLADYGRIRVMADRLGIESIDREGPDRRLKVQAAGEARSGAALPLVQQRGDLTLVPPATLKLDLKKAASRPTEPAPGRSRRSPAAAARKAETRWPAARGGRRGRRPAR